MWILKPATFIIIIKTIFNSVADTFFLHIVYMSPILWTCLLFKKSNLHVISHWPIIQRDEKRAREVLVQIIGPTLLYFFFYLYVAKKVLFLSQVSEIDILMDSTFSRFLNPQNFNGWPACVSVIRITQKQIIKETLNLVFYNLSYADATWNFLWSSEK